MNYYSFSCFEWASFDSLFMENAAHVWKCQSNILWAIDGGSNECFEVVSAGGQIDVGRNSKRNLVVDGACRAAFHSVISETFHSVTQSGKNVANWMIGAANGWECYKITDDIRNKHNFPHDTPGFHIRSPLKCLKFSIHQRSSGFHLINCLEQT